MPTTSISLIRSHTEIIKPPRALWVPFDLGRPLGVPNNPVFQRRVLVSALKLLEATEGPVLKDFPDEAPVSSAEPVILACPYVPPESEVVSEPTDRLCRSFKMEMTSMRPWYDRALKERGRTVFGISHLTTDTLGDFLCSFLENNPPENPRQDVPLDYELRYAADDLKVYYYEAITAQPGADLLTGEAIDKWFWEDTIASKVLRAVREICLKSENELLRRTAARQIIPQKILSPHAEGK